MSFPKTSRAALRWGGLVLASLLLAACASPKNRAPVEDRGTSVRAANPAPAPAPSTNTEPGAAADPNRPLPGSENAGKPGYYTVKPGDVLIRIAFENGQSSKDLVKWNNLDNPNVLEVGQVLRVVPPGTDSTIARAVGTAKVEMRPLDAKPTAPTAGASAPPPAATGTAAPPAAALPAPASPTPVVAAREGDDDLNWQWPAAGPLTAPFEDGKSKGLIIGGKAGDPVFAAADGRVVYAGSGLRGYGNLVILKHNNTYLTAYAHNQTLLVKEDQAVRRGQKIAEMGASDAERVQLHFEIRRQGKPVDPARLLPPR